MAPISCLLPLTFLAIGSLANSGNLGLFKGQLKGQLLDPQDLELALQNQQTADSVLSPCELRNQRKAHSTQEEYLPIQLNLNLKIELPQPKPNPQYDLDVGLPTDISAQLLNGLQSQPKPPIWIISEPPSQSQLYLLPQYQNPLLYSLAQVPIYQQNVESDDRVVQSLNTLSQLESQLQIVNAQIHDLQSASETFSNLNLDTSAPLQVDPSVYGLAQLLDDKSQISQLQNQTVQSPNQSYNSSTLTQSQNQTVNSSGQLLGSLSPTQSHNQTVSISGELLGSLSTTQSQNQTIQSSGQLINSQSLSQLQNQTLNSLNQSGSHTQTQNQTVESSQSLTQLQNQTLNSLNQSGVTSQTQTQNQTVESSQSLTQLQNQTLNSLNQSGSHTQTQNQTVGSSQSQTQLQNQTVNSLNQLGSQTHTQNQTVESSQSQNQTVNCLGKLQGSQSQSQSQHQTIHSSGVLHRAQSQTQSQNLTVSCLDLPGLLPQSQNQTVESLGQADDSLPLSKLSSTTIAPIDASDNINKNINKYVVDNPPPFLTTSDIEDDAKLQTFALIEKYGYPSETHYVYTDDGYKLGMHRIPRPGAQPVLLVHGLMSSSASWVQFGPKNGLAYILYRKGYDVWMLNTRGNLYSREHQNKKLSQREYWDFSFHEIGKFDLPAAIDLILQITHQAKVQYIGHSQGSTVFFVMCSERPEYSSKVNLMQAMAPTVYLQDNRSPVLKFLGMFKGKFSMLVNLLGGYEISSETRLIKQFREHICTRSELASRICAIFDFVLCGFDWKNFNETLTPIVAAHASQGTSAKQIYHYAQMDGKLSFQSFDHGRVLNRLRYNDVDPPSYNLSMTATKVVIHHSGGDWLGVNSDVSHLEKGLTNLVESRKIQEEGFAHFDFTISKDVRTLVYDSVLGHLENHRFTRL